MEKKYMERLVGKHCKIVTKEPGEERANVVIGILEDVDYKDGFILVDSEQGLGCLRINTIVAIKPAQKHSMKNNIKKDTKAMVGIGTLIVFIAMILVAAVAASVLINTGETLQTRAKNVGMSTIKEVSHGIAIEQISGYTNVNKTIIEYLAFTVRPRAGSKYIDLSLCTLSIIHNNLSILKMNQSLVQTVNLDNQSVFYTPIEPGSSIRLIDNTSNIYFGVIAIHDPDNSITKTFGMNSGDRAILVVNLSAITDTGGLLPRSEISGTLAPEIGIKSEYDIITPPVFSMRIIKLS